MSRMANGSMPPSVSPRVTQAGHELYLKSLRRADTKQVARDMARGTLVQDFKGGRGAD